MLHWYSIRMVNNMWLSRDGKKVDIEFMNAFKLSETRTYSIRDFGYMQPSRLFNVDTFTHKQEETLYINMNRNNYAAMPEYQKVIKTIYGIQVEGISCCTPSKRITNNLVLKTDKIALKFD